MRRLAAKGPLTGYIGWTAAENLGDDAMLEAARGLLGSRDVEVFSGGRREALLAHMGLSGGSMFSRIFLGGGTLINHGYLGVVQRALSFGVPVSTLGTGVGGSGFSALSEAIPAAWRDALAGFRKVGVRGPRSLAKLRDIGVANATIVGDLALAVTPDVSLADMGSGCFLLNAAVPGAQDAVGISEGILDGVALAARRMTELGWRAIPVAFSAEDVTPTARVLRDAGVTATEIAQPRSAEDFFRLARCAGLAIGVRLHCTVLSCCAGIAPVGVAYREKGIDFAESMDISRWMVDPARMGRYSLAERAEELTQISDGVGKAAHERALHWRDALRSYAANA